MKASDISDETLLAAHEAVKGRNGVWHWSTTWDIQERLSAFPPKVVLAKLASANRRRVLLGCACGCRGDWHTQADENEPMSKI